MLVLIGESGSGKTTILEELEKRGFEKVINHTTRKRRGNENDEYRFVTKEEFERLWEQKKLLQRAEFDGEYYGISIDSYQKDTVGILTRDGLQDLKDRNFQTTSFYIRVPEEIRKQRMKERGDSNEEIQARVKIDKEKFQNADKIADYTISNIHLENTVKEIIEKYKYKIRQLEEEER